MSKLADTPLGPYQLHASYKWCTKHAWWGLGLLCTEETTETFNSSIDFSWTKTSLKSVLSEAQNNSNTFNSSYIPWVNGIKPLSQKFSEKTELIKSIQQQIKAGNGPTEQQRTTVTQAIQELCDDLNASSAQLQSLTKSLTAFLDRQSAMRETIKKTIAQTAQHQQEALSNAETSARKSCSQSGTFDNLRSQFDQIKKEFNASTQAISNSFQNLETSSREAEKSIAFLLGFVVSASSELHTVLDKVKAAQKDDLGSFIQSIHLTTAQKQWENLGKGQ